MEMKGLTKEYRKFKFRIAIIGSILGWLLCTGIYIPIIMVVDIFVDKYNIGFDIYFIWFFWIYILPVILTIIFYNMWIKRYVKTYEWEITDEEVIIRQGVLTRSESRVPFSRIQNVGLVQKFWEKIFGWYRLLIQTAGGPIRAGTMAAEGRIVGLRDPKPIQNAILNRAKKYLVSGKPGIGETKVLKREPSEFPEIVSDKEEIDEIKNKLDQIIDLLKDITKKL